MNDIQKLKWAKMLPPKMLADGRWWQEAWSLIGGCTKVSGACDHCWLEKQEAWLKTNGTTTDRVWNGKIITFESRLDKPLKMKKPTVFSIWSDLFHEDVPDEFIDKAFTVMARCPQHLFVILTKRPERMNLYIDNLIEIDVQTDEFPFNKVVMWPLPNVVLGTSVENQETADERIPHLIDTPAACRIISYEPALGPVDFRVINEGKQYTNVLNSVLFHKSQGKIALHSRQPEHLDGVIMGGESGHGARPMHPEWARSVRDQCKAAGVPFFFKQWGEWASIRKYYKKAPNGATARVFSSDGFNVIMPSAKDVANPKEISPDTVAMWRVGKKKAGRKLDGVIHSDLPEVG